MPAKCLDYNSILKVLGVCHICQKINFNSYSTDDIYIYICRLLDRHYENDPTNDRKESRQNCHTVHCIVNNRSPTIREVAQVIGNLVAAFPAFPYGQLIML